MRLTDRHAHGHAARRIPSLTKRQVQRRSASRRTSPSITLPRSTARKVRVPKTRWQSQRGPVLRPAAVLTPLQSIVELANRAVSKMPRAKASSGSGNASTMSIGWSLMCIHARTTNTSRNSQLVPRVCHRHRRQGANIATQNVSSHLLRIAAASHRRR